MGAIKSFSGIHYAWIDNFILALISSVFSFCLEMLIVVAHEKVCFWKILLIVLIFQQHQKLLVLQEWWRTAHLWVPKHQRKGFDSLVILVVWCIWKHRNACVFEGLPEILFCSCGHMWVLSSCFFHCVPIFISFLLMTIGFCQYMKFSNSWDLEICNGQSLI